VDKLINNESRSNEIFKTKLDILNNIDFLYFVNIQFNFGMIVF